MSTLNGTTPPVRIYHPSTVDQYPSTEPTTEPTNTDQPQQTASTMPSAEHKPHKPWPLFIIGLAAAVAVWSGWVGLGNMAGFGMVRPLPGIWDDLRINTTFVLPLSVEAYAAYALRVWVITSSRHMRTQRFAKWSAIISMIIGAVAQVAYHLMAAAGLTHAPWPVVMLVATVPVVVLGLASALAKMVTNDQNDEATS